MVKINENFKDLKENYLFSTVAKKVSEFQEKNPNKKVIKLGIGDVTRPIPNSCIKAMKRALDEMSNSKTFRGYGPEQGYEFLRKAIVDNEYKNLIMAIYCGNGRNDLDAMKYIRNRKDGFVVCPQNSRQQAKAIANFVSKKTDLFGISEGIGNINKEIEKRVYPERNKEEKKNTLPEGPEE